MKNSNKNLYKSSLQKVFNVIKTTFPFQNQVELKSFFSLYKKWRGGLKNIKNDQDFFLFLEEFLASLKNSHTELSYYPNKQYKQFFKPKGYQVIKIENGFFLKKNNKIIGGQIIAIDNKNPNLILKQAIKRMSGPTKQYLTQQALKFILTDSTENKVKIKLKIGNRIIEKILKRTLIKFQPFKKNIESKIIDGGIGYLKIRSWTNKEKSINILNDKINYFLKRKIKSLIIDIRDNSGGDSSIAKNLASHFFNRKVLFGITKNKIYKNNLKLFTNYLYVDPQKPYLNMPIFLLINAKCFSSSEYFVAGMKYNKRALLIGETTGGGSGNPKKIIIPFRDSSFELLVSTWIYYKPNKNPLEGIGIKPNIVIKPTIKSIKTQKDEVLNSTLILARKITKKKGT